MFARLRLSFLVVALAAVGSLSACGGAQVKSGDDAPCCSGGKGEATCPVSGAKFTPTDATPKVEHEGKTYAFCCGGCAAKFKADPAKYAAAASAADAAPCHAEEGKSDKDCGPCCPKCKEGCKDCPKCKEAGCANCEDCKKGSCAGCGA